MKLPYRRLCLQLFLFASFALSILVRPASATIRYRVSLDHPELHLFHVQVSIPNAEPGITVAMPAWNALYQLRDFAYRVRDVRASAAGDTSCSVRKLDKQTWKVDCSGTPSSSGEVAIDYFIEWDDPGPFSSQLNTHHAFINLAEILMYLPDRRGEDTSVQFVDLPAGWRTAAELGREDVDNTYIASSYDKLVDAPVEAGKFEEFHFTSGGARFRVILDSENANRAFLEGALSRITEYELQLMGGPPFDPPSHEYTFIFHVGSDDDAGGGGMEHSNSTAIAARSVEAAGAIAAHEFFHAWNVKRIRPRNLEPIDYTREQYTRALWFAEGVTSTYAAYTLERTGLWSKNQFYVDLATQIGELQSRPAHKWQSADEASLDAWFEKYDAYLSKDRSISYYNKGQILGVLLDLAIRDATDNHRSLDDVLRKLNADYAQQGKFYDEDDGIRKAVEEVAGKSFQEFFRRYVSGTDEIPYDDFLQIAGLELKTEPSHSPYPGMSGSSAYSIVEIPNPTDRQRRIREGILRGATD